MVVRTSLFIVLSLSLTACKGSSGSTRKAESKSAPKPAQVAANENTGGAEAPAEKTDEAAMIPIPNARMHDGVLVGGQPTDSDLRRAQEHGYSTIINLRTEGEPGTHEESGTVEKLGMAYISIPVAGANGLTEENARALAKALDDATGKAMVHCASGNRVGALFAVKANKIDGKSPAESLEIGEAAGMTRLEPAVAKLLNGQ